LSAGHQWTGPPYLRSREVSDDGPGKLGDFDPTLTSLSGVYLAQIAIGTLGVLVISSAYGSGMIRATFAAVPQRRAVLAAKAIVFGACTLVLGEVMSFAAFGIGQAILSTAHPQMSGIQASASLSQPDVLRAVCGAGLYLTVVGLLGFGLGAAIRHTAGALPACFGVLFGLSAIVDLLPTSWRNDICRTCRPMPAARHSQSNKATTPFRHGPG